MRINNDFIIVGVDAGYGNMKTANTIFPTGLAAMDTEPYFCLLYTSTIPAPEVTRAYGGIYANQQ